MAKRKTMKEQVQKLLRDEIGVSFPNLSERIADLLSRELARVRREMRCCGNCDGCYQYAKGSVVENPCKKWKPRKAVRR